MNDARFQDGAENPIKLLAQDVEDLSVLSTLIQDAIAERSEMLYEAEKHSFSLLLKRFRWEDAEDAKRQNREFERVQSVLIINSVRNIQFQGFDSNDKNLIFDLIGIVQKDDHLHIVFAGDGEIKLEIEAVDVSLSDVSRPYIAKSQDIPEHANDEAN